MLICFFLYYKAYWSVLEMRYSKHCIYYLPHVSAADTREVTGKFFWGGKVVFPDFFPGVKCFFPVEKFPFGRPKTNFRHFQKSKAKTYSVWPFTNLLTWYTSNKM